MIYIVVFFLSTIFSILAQKNNQKKLKFIIFSILSILLPTVLAALRSTCIGTDVEVYVVPLFNSAIESTSFKVFTKLVSAHDIELLFELLIYVSTKIFKNINMTLFFIHLPICALFYTASNIYKEKGYPPIIYLLFLLTYYNMSLNIMRQFIAVAIIFCCFKYLEEGKCIKYIFWIFIATLFHSTAIISLIFIPIYKACKSKRRIMYSVILIVVLCITLIYYNRILTILYNLGIIPYKYIIRYSISNSNININIVDEIVRIYHLLLIFLQGKIMQKNTENIFYTIIAIFDFILLQLSIFVPFAQRICIFFTIFSFLNIARIIRQSKINKAPITLATIMLYLVFFIYSYIYIGISETSPYIIGI